MLNRKQGQHIQKSDTQRFHEAEEYFLAQAEKAKAAEENALNATGLVEQFHALAQARNAWRRARNSLGDLVGLDDESAKRPEDPIAARAWDMAVAADREEHRVLNQNAPLFDAILKILEEVPSSLDREAVTQQAEVAEAMMKHERAMQQEAMALGERRVDHMDTWRSDLRLAQMRLAELQHSETAQRAEKAAMSASDLLGQLSGWTDATFAWYDASRCSWAEEGKEEALDNMRRTKAEWTAVVSEVVEFSRQPLQTVEQVVVEEIAALAEFVVEFHARMAEMLGTDRSAIMQPWIEKAGEAHARLEEIAVEDRLLTGQDAGRSGSWTDRHGTRSSNGAYEGRW